MNRTPLACILLLICSASIASAQVEAMPVDSTASDTLLVRIIDGIGDAYPGRPMNVLADSQWYWSDVRTLPDAFAMIPGVYRFDEGEDGRPVHAWYLGSDWSSEGITIDGIPIGSPLFAASALSLFPFEFVESIEYLRGPASLLAGGRWNLRTHQQASPEPITAVRYVQSPNETIFTDGMFTQNIARSTTAHFGFQRRTSNGRFDNAAFDSWALRGRLRYNVSPRLNFMGSWSYDRTSQGTNGGIDRTVTATIFDEVSAVVVEPQAYEIRTHSSLSLHALANVLDDSLSLTRFTISGGDEEREFHRPLSSIRRPKQQEYAISAFSQLRLEQSFSLPFFLVRAMGQIRTVSSTDSTILRSIRRSSNAFGGSIEARLTSLLIPSFGVRIDDTPEGSRTSYAARADLHLIPDLTISATLEQRSLFPGLRETAWGDSLVSYGSTPTIGSERFSSITARWDLSHSSYIALEGFQRDQTDRLIYVPDTTAFGSVSISSSYEDTDIMGIQISGKVTVSTFSLSGWLTSIRLERSPRLANTLPQTWARWEIGWKNRFFEQELGLQVTLRGMFYDRHEGFAPDPRTGLQVLQSSVQIGRLTRLDGFFVLDIGQAYITLAWENILSTNYFTVPTYPMPDRRFSLGVRWQFRD